MEYWIESFAEWLIEIVWKIKVWYYRHFKKASRKQRREIEEYFRNL